MYSVSTTHSNTPAIKLEPTYFTVEDEEVLLAAGYVKRGSSSGGYNYRGGKENQSIKRGGRGARSGRKMLNAPGLDGKPKRCVSCDSIRHLLPDCPDSWENMAAVAAGGQVDQRCWSCGSGDHRWPDCPDAWEDPLADEANQGDDGNGRCSGR